MWSFDLAEKNKDFQVIAVNPWSLLDTKMANEAFWTSWSPVSKWVNILYNLSIWNEYSWITWVFYDNDKWDFWKAHEDAYNKEIICNLIEHTENILSNYKEHRSYR